MTCPDRHSQETSEPTAAQGALAVDVNHCSCNFNTGRVGKQGFAANLDKRTVGGHDAGVGTQIDNDVIAKSISC